MKPLAPVLKWIRAYTGPGSRVIVPCAGTAPAAIDVEPETKAAYERRRTDELEYQTGLEAFTSQ